jgi:hypothetical protein
MNVGMTLTLSFAGRFVKPCDLNFFLDFSTKEFEPAAARPLGLADARPGIPHRKASPEKPAS